jgi:Fe-S oxidoreductase
MKCPVIDFSREEAIDEINHLLAGSPTKKILSNCTLCFNCNHYCPQDLRPYELILENVINQRKRWISNCIPYFLNGMQPNFFQDQYDRLDNIELDILKQWAKIPPPSDDILWVGCIGRLSCLDIEQSIVLKDLPKYGPMDLCCGELHYRFGSWTAYTEMIEKTIAQFERLHIKRMVCYCGSCYNLLSKTMPNVYGKKLPFELISMYQWILEKAEQGILKVKHPIKKRAAIHESCYVSELESDYRQTLYQLYQMIGIDIYEMEHTGDHNISCGLASAARDLNILKSVLPAQLKRFQEAKATSADHMALNCPGCYLSMAMTAPVFRMNLLNMSEEILVAFGDTIQKPLSSRIFSIIKAFMMRTSYLIRQFDTQNW